MDIVCGSSLGLLGGCVTSRDGQCCLTDENSHADFQEKVIDGYCVCDMVSRSQPKSYMFVTKDRDLAEAKFNERLAISGAEFVSANFPVGMVLGSLADSKKYEALHPRFAKVFEFLRSHDLAELPLGRHEIDGNDAYVNVSDTTLNTWDPGANIEVHRKYFDIHVPISGDEINGFVYNEECAKSADFNVADDYALFRDPKMSKIVVKKGEFVIFYPNCGAHAPNKTEGAPRIHRKIVVKILAQPVCIGCNTDVLSVNERELFSGVCDVL